MSAIPIPSSDIATLAANLLLLQERLETTITLFEKSTGIRFRQIVANADAATLVAPDEVL